MDRDGTLEQVAPGFPATGAQESRRTCMNDPAPDCPRCRRPRRDSNRTPNCPACTAVLEAAADPLPEAVDRLRSGKSLNSRQVNALCTRSGGILALAQAGFFNPR